MGHYVANDRGAVASRSGRRRTWRGFSFSVAVCVVCCLQAGKTQTVSEYAVKAAYLYNFAKYAEWPEQSLSSGTAPFVIGVFSGDDEFIDALKKTVAGKTAGTHPIVVKRVSLPEEMDFCQMIFLRATSGRKRTEDAIAVLATASVLLVGEEANFLRQGGMINLVLKNGTIRFEINKGALDRARVRLGPSLLAAVSGESGSSGEPAVSATPGEARRLKVSTPPEYPDIAKRMNIRGTVQLELTVARDGTVKDVKIIGGHPILTDAMVKSVRGWRYEPAPKESQVVVKFVFAP